MTSLYMTSESLNYNIHFDEHSLKWMSSPKPFFPLFWIQWGRLTTPNPFPLCTKKFLLLFKAPMEIFPLACCPAGTGFTIQKLNICNRGSDKQNMKRGFILPFPYFTKENNCYFCLEDVLEISLYLYGGAFLAGQKVRVNFSNG